MYEGQRLTAIGTQEWSIDTIVTDAIADFLPTRHFGRVLDYGAGNSPYRACISCDHYVKADLAQNVAGDIDFIIRPSEKLPQPDADFDLILLLDVLEHVTEPVFVLEELRRLLKPGGRAILSLPFMYREHEAPHDHARYTAFGISALVEAQGGRVLRLKKVGNVGCTLVSLFLERGVTNGEIVKLSRPGRIANRLLNLSLGLFGRWLKKAPSEDASIYHHLLLEIDFQTMPA